MKDTSKVLGLIALLLVLLVEEVKARALARGIHRNNHHHHQKLHQDRSKFVRHHKTPHHLAPIFDVDEGSLQLDKEEHSLRKRHYSESTDSEVISDVDIEALKASSNEYHETYDRKVKEAENNSVCNYTVTPFTNSEEYIIPKDLVDIKCNSLGSRCQDVGAYCCVQTWTMIQVELRKGGTRSMRINTGCVCALSLYATLHQNQLSPDIDQ